MKRISQLWDKIISQENLYAAYCKAAKGKRNRPDVQWFALNLEEELLTLHLQLTRQQYQPGQYRQFTLYERKPRLISVAPFRDRVVHHAIMNHLEPLLDKKFIPDSYACRKNRGSP